MHVLLSSLVVASLTDPQVVPTAPSADPHSGLADAVHQAMPEVVAWRRELHEHPELSNREVRTSALIAAELKRLGLEVQTGIAHHGVVGILRGAKPGKLVALRADMDALPVTEQVNLPFSSKVTADFNGTKVGVMHACGHDAHVAMLLGAATVLTQMRGQLAGDVMFIFQPAEEGPPAGEEGGAKLMLKQGLFGKRKPDAIFGIHVWPAPAGQLLVRPEGTMAAADSFEITVRGKQVHGSSPWRGIDPIAVVGQLITALHQIPARQLDVTQAPAVLSIGQVHGGIRWNIIPDEVTLGGTIRTFDPAMRKQLLHKMQHTVTHIAAASGASAAFRSESFAAVTWNHAELTKWAMPALEWAGAKAGVAPTKPLTASEDFSYFQQEVPGVFLFLGIAEPGQALEKTPPNHSPLFRIYEPALESGVRAFTKLTIDFLAQAPKIAK